MTHVSSDLDALPPRDAPLADRLCAAIRLAGNPSNRQIAEHLGTDGSLVGKWLSGDVQRITSRGHREKLPEFLRTPPGYFDDRDPRSRRELEAEVDFLSEAVIALLGVATATAQQVVALGGEIPAEMLDGLRRVAEGRRP
jgi:hypothetical protein